MLIKGIIQSEDITVLNIYAPNIGGPKFIKQTLLNLKEQIGSDTILTGDLKMQFSSMDRTSRQKINKDNLELNNTTDKMDLTDIYRLVHTLTAH
jgi:hypothetical protein